MMDMCQVSEKMLQDRQPNTMPVSTFADGQYCWALPNNIRKFHERAPEVVKRLPTLVPPPPPTHTRFSGALPHAGSQPQLPSMLTPFGRGAAQ